VQADAGESTVMVGIVPHNVDFFFQHEMNDTPVRSLSRMKPFGREASLTEELAPGVKMLVLLEEKFSLGVG